MIEKLEAHGGKVGNAVACNGVKKEWASAGIDGQCLPFSDQPRCRLRLQQAPSVFGPCQIDDCARRKSRSTKQSPASAPDTCDSSKMRARSWGCVKKPAEARVIPLFQLLQL